MRCDHSVMTFANIHHLGVLYIIEVQPTWYTPAPKLLGWWIGLFNLIGAIGWTLSASFGYCSASW